MIYDSFYLLFLTKFHKLYLKQYWNYNLYNLKTLQNKNKLKCYDDKTFNLRRSDMMFAEFFHFKTNFIDKSVGTITDITKILVKNLTSLSIKAIKTLFG